VYKHERIELMNSYRGSRPFSRKVDYNQLRESKC